MNLHVLGDDMPSAYRRSSDVLGDTTDVFSTLSTIATDIGKIGQAVIPLVSNNKTTQPSVTTAPYVNAAVQTASTMMPLLIIAGIGLATFLMLRRR